MRDSASNFASSEQKELLKSNFDAVVDAIPADVDTPDSNKMKSADDWKNASVNSAISEAGQLLPIEIGNATAVSSRQEEGKDIEDPISVSSGPSNAMTR